ncbi:MAG: threonine/serine exporter family protein [Bacteroides sp.]|nr:threonine/serine exporter family protein [Bacteroides sp.]MCM1422140.1 threonine/serine exporter family protein [Bacteroides sp.]
MTELTDSTAPSVKAVCKFLSEYAAALLGCGATCIRIEKNVARMADKWHTQVQMTIMPRHIHITVWTKDKLHSYSAIECVRNRTISFEINSRLSRLSWAVADGRCDFSGAVNELDSCAKTRPYNEWLVLGLVSLANASFCRLFGGDVAAMLIVCVCTLFGYRLKQVLLSCKTDVRVVFLCSAFFSSLIGTAGYVPGFHTDTPDIALATSVLYLIPGIPYINSVHDLIDGHYIMAFCRLADAAILTGCLSVGFCGGLILMGIEWF